MANNKLTEEQETIIASICSWHAKRHCKKRMHNALVYAVRHGYHGDFDDVIARLKYEKPNWFRSR